MEPLRPGECRHRIWFDEPVTSRNSIGEAVTNYSPAFSVWGKIEPLNGRERLLAEQVSAQMDTRIRFFWSRQAERITAKWRARHASVNYNIVSPPAHIEFARREFEILASNIE